MDQATRFCTNCGRQLVVGRYCTNCGTRVADPAAAAPAPPPVAGPAPPAARYPLFADTVQAAASPVGPPPSGPPPSGPPPSGPPPSGPPPSGPPPAGPPHTPVVPRAPTPYDGGPPARRRSVIPWLIGALALAVFVLVGAGVVLLAQSGDDAGDRGRDDQGAQRDRSARVDRKPGLTPTDIAVPVSAPASVDDDGNRVTFVADNMLDSDPRTSWRMPGDGSGSVVTFTFDDAVTVTEVGLINGYAKTDPPHDWYAGNRRIESVTWVFDDGTEVTQDLSEVRDPQMVDVDAGETSTVELRIVAVSAPGGGPDGRDYTAISDVELVGSR